ncbi:hypothetical protein MMC25_007725 [Agyrium rufum]|nr:hypothetical protein [Agyrium rufum]
MEHDDTRFQLLYYVHLIVPKIYTKSVQTNLDERALSDRNHKTTTLPSDSFNDQNFYLDAKEPPTEGSLIPTAIKFYCSPLLNVSTELQDQRVSILRKLDIEHIRPNVKLAVPTQKYQEELDLMVRHLSVAKKTASGLVIEEQSASGTKAKTMNKLAAAVLTWLVNLPPSVHSILPRRPYEMVYDSNWNYSVYPPMLLLAQGTFDRSPWTGLLDGQLQIYVGVLYKGLCDTFGVTHVAVNKAIPLRLEAGISGHQDSDGTDEWSEPNILRLPTQLKPLYGYFGLDATFESIHFSFETALWVSTNQYGIIQMWAPMHTMFSRGNIKEKTRVLEFTKECMPDEYERSRSTAVDLYAGIGYFSFFYAKAGFGLVLGWELNEWSVQGFERGAKANGWDVRSVGDGAAWEGKPRKTDEERQRLVVFQEDNLEAAKRVDSNRNQIPPVRHVNCGLLPTSYESWPTALRVLDPTQKGWIHAHLNIDSLDIDRGAGAIITIFNSLEKSLAQQRNVPKRMIKCEHVSQVKTYAPYLMHCVLDISVTPATLHLDYRRPPQLPPRPG